MKLSQLGNKAMKKSIFVKENSFSTISLNELLIKYHFKSKYCFILMDRRDFEDSEGLFRPKIKFVKPAGHQFL